MPTIVAMLVMFTVVGVGVAATGGTPSALLVGAVLAAGGIAMGMKGWNDSSVPKSPKGWLVAAAACLGVGAGVYAVECAVGKLVHPELAFLEAGLRTGPFGGLCTVAITGWIALFAIGGAAYRSTEHWMQRKAKDLP